MFEHDSLPMHLLDRDAMEVQEVSEYIGVRKNRSPREPINHSLTRQVSLEDTVGEVSVEYKPDEYRLLEYPFEELAGTDFFVVPAEEEIVRNLYYALADLLYPEYTTSDEPWEELPMVVELVSEQVAHLDTDAHRRSITLGSYR